MTTIKNKTKNPTTFPIELTDISLLFKTKAYHLSKCLWSPLTIFPCDLKSENLAMTEEKRLWNIDVLNLWFGLWVSLLLSLANRTQPLPGTWRPNRGGFGQLHICARSFPWGSQEDSLASTFTCVLGGYDAVHWGLTFLLLVALQMIRSACAVACKLWG